MRFFIAIILFTFISCRTKQADNIQSTPVPSQPTSAAEAIRDDTLIISERIDGPANIRERVNGKLLFTLNDNVQVSANEATGKWLQVGVFADLTQEQMDNLLIRKGSKILTDGREVGEAVEDIQVTSAFESADGNRGELTGFTSVSNIKYNSVVENVFTNIVNASSGSLTKKNFSRLLKDFQFNDFGGLLAHFKGYEIEENWIDDPSPMLRLWLIFKGENFYGVFHSRPLHLNNASTVKVERSFYFTTFSHDQKTNKELINAFNSYIVQVD